MIEQYTAETLGAHPYTSLLVNRDIPMHTHYFWEFTYVISGELVNAVNSERIRTPALSEIILIRPGDTHQIFRENAAPDQPTQYHRDIYVSPEKMKKLCDFLDPDLYASLLNEPRIILDAKNHFLESLEYTLNFFSRKEAMRAEAIGTLEQLHTTVVFQLLGMIVKNRLQIKSDYPQWIDDFFDLIKTEEGLCTPIGELICKLHYSHSYICRTFKKHVGKTMVQCLNENRIIHSTIFLMDKSMSILDIAMRMNYNSQSAYINAFKKIYGISPSKWRERQLNA